MRSHVASLLVLSIVEVLFLAEGPRAHGQTSVPVKSSREKSGTRWSSLPPNAQRAVQDVLRPVNADWTQQAELAASDAGAYDFFSGSLAFNGSTIVVGAPQHSFGVFNTYQGAVYIFEQNSSGSWIQHEELTSSDGAAGDLFGSSVAISGSTVIVGAPGHTVGSNTHQGTAYVFVESGGTWSQQAELTASDGEAFDSFGSSVAADGSIVMVGAPCHPAASQYCDPVLGDGPGAAYVFVEVVTSWIQQAELRASDGVVGDLFGASIAAEGSIMVIGAPCHPVPPGLACNTVAGGSPGAAYVFAESGGTWSQQAELTASDGMVYDYFGGSVAVDASLSTVAVGAPSHTVGSNRGQGAVYLFIFSVVGSTWPQLAELTASDGAASDTFGARVAMDGSTAVVGAPNHTFGSNAHQGTAYIFGEENTNWSQQAELISSDGTTYADFGASVAISGSTVMVGAPCHSYSAGACGPGAAYAFAGPGYTLSASPSSLSVAQGSQATSTITITLVNGFTGSVSFSVSGLPAGVTASFSASPVTTSTTLTLTASATAPTGVATVTVIGTSLGLTQTTPITLTVTTAATVSLPTLLNFGNEALNIASAAKTITLTNTGTATLNISNITASAQFAISAKTCGATVAAGKKCTVSVTFTPNQLSAITGNLSFIDDAANSPQTVLLKGTGALQATLTPSWLTFGTTQVGTTSQTKKVTFTNNLPTALTGISYSIAAPFAISSSTCTSTLASKKSCAIEVTFAPTQTGTATGTLKVSDKANNSPQTVSLSGTTDTVYLSPASVNFGLQSVGKTSNPIKVDLFNEGTTQITVTSVNTTGDFVVTENYCMTGVKPNTHCYVGVVFNPTQSGALSGTLTFVDSATNSPQTASLSGTGN